MAEADNVGLGHKIEMSSPNLSMKISEDFYWKQNFILIKVF